MRPASGLARRAQLLLGMLINASGCAVLIGEVVARVLA
jgi:hypothetical protein